MHRDNSPNKRLESEISIIATPALMVDSRRIFSATVLTSRKARVVESVDREADMMGMLRVGGGGNPMADGGVVAERRPLHLRSSCILCAYHRSENKVPSISPYLPRRGTTSCHKKGRAHDKG